MKIYVYQDQHGMIPPLGDIRELLSPEELARVRVVDGKDWPEVVFDEPDQALYEILLSRLSAYYGIGEKGRG